METHHPRINPASGDTAVECIFCQIVAGTAPASIVYADAILLAFLDLHPIAPGHTLIVPRSHAARLADLDEASGMRMVAVAMRLERALRAAYPRYEGVNLLLADGKAAGQEVAHVHLHIIPRVTGDGIRFANVAARRAARSTLDAVAVQLRAALS